MKTRTTFQNATITHCFALAFFFYGLFQYSQLTSAEAESAAASQFGQPAEAVAALAQALSAKDLTALQRIFGPGLTNIVNPDPVEATNEFEAIAAALVQTNRLVAEGKGRMMVEFGEDASLFPVPLVENAGRWSFDTAAGTEEIINRRIGRNELAVLELVRTYLQAQREYASADRDGDEVLEYAQRFRSTDGAKDGLYWNPEIDGTISPLGPFFAEAEAEGHAIAGSEGRHPFHGYYFRIMTKQGKHAPGGAHDYIINGNMIAGFALIAWPAEYDVTGVMTFIVNQQGRVFQKDLGAETGTTGESMAVYDPGEGWTPSKD